MMHTEWDTARGCEIGATTREEANTEWALDQSVDEPCVLVLGGGGGGCLAVEGTSEDLVRFAERVSEAVAALPGLRGGSAVILEAVCGRCDETFNPADEDDLEHGVREDGAECGGVGELRGEWHSPPETAPDGGRQR